MFILYSRKSYNDAAALETDPSEADNLMRRVQREKESGKNKLVGFLQVAANKYL